MTKRMNEERAIEILKKAREYYSMNRQGYDDVIKWLEGRIKRRKKVTDEKPYPMTSDRTEIQMDCRNTTCMYYKSNGDCTNIAPAISLNPDGSYVCWSKLESEQMRKKCEHCGDEELVLVSSMYWAKRWWQFKKCLSCGHETYDEGEE